MYRFKGKRWSGKDQKDDAPDALIGAIMLAVEKRRARILSLAGRSFLFSLEVPKFIL